jgi:G3E family GTPase
MKIVAGLADPGNIGQTFWVDEGLSNLYLDGIVTLCDAYNVNKTFQVPISLFIYFPLLINHFAAFVRDDVPNAGLK